MEIFVILTNFFKMSTYILIQKTKCAYLILFFFYLEILSTKYMDLIVNI